MDSTVVFGTISLSSNLSRTASIFSATFSATYFYYEKSELYLKKKDTKQNFGIGGISISLVLQSNLSKYF